VDNDSGINQRNSDKHAPYLSGVVVVAERNLEPTEVNTVEFKSQASAIMHATADLLGEFAARSSLDIAPSSFDYWRACPFRPLWRWYLGHSWQMLWMAI